MQLRRHQSRSGSHNVSEQDTSLDPWPQVLDTLACYCRTHAVQPFGERWRAEDHFARSREKGLALSDWLVRPPMLEGDDCVADDIGDTDCDSSVLGEDGIVNKRILSELQARDDVEREELVRGHGG
jgi:hypothetical protein